MKYKISDDATLKSKITGEGELSGTLRTRITKGWTLVASTSFNAQDLYGKIAPRVGLGIEAVI